jgi:DNA-binding transcriptional LysR family regulator
MDTDDLAILIEVVRAGSFAAAARARSADPSAISRAVATLEARLGARLFQRSTRRISLTEAGEAFVARVAPLIEELDRARAAVRDAAARPEGHLRLTASVTFGQEVILPLLPAFHAAHPGIAVDGLFTDSNVDLVGERIDLAVRLAPEVEGDVIVSRLMDTRYRVVAAPEYEARAGVVGAPDDLRAHRLLRFGLAPFRDRWLFRPAQGGPVTEVPVAGDVVLAPPLALREAARAGMGAALLPGWLVDGDVRAGRLVRLLPDWDVTATTFDTGAFLVYPSRAYLPGKVRAMIDFLRAAVAEGRIGERG